MIISDVIFSLPLIIVRTNATLMTNTKSIEKGIYSCHSNISDAIKNYSFQVIIGIFNWFVNFYLLDTNLNICFHFYPHRLTNLSLKKHIVV